MITPEIGKSYVVRHSSGLIDATFVRVKELPGNPQFGWKSRTHYIFFNCKTGHDIEIKSRVKILRQLGTEPYERFY